MPTPVTGPAPVSPTNPTTPVVPAAQVKKAERLLKAAGFNPGVVDGKPSPAFESALKEFQTSWGLPASGVPDAATMAKLQHTADRIHAHKKDGFLSVGQKGKDVLQVEKQLRALGYDVGKADGVYSKQTFAAVKAFKADQADIKNEAGAIAKHGRSVLAREVAELRHDPERRRLAPSTHQKTLDARTAQRAASANADGSTGFGVGAHGGSVENVQRHLRAAGYDPQHTNGTFDERTAGALKAFQRHAGLKATGRVDAQTWKRLKTSFILSKSGTSPAQALGERSAAVKKTEALLKKAGFNPGKVDGLFDERTFAAVRAFEKKKHLHRDGEVGTHDLSVLKKAAATSVHGITVTNEMRRLAANGRSVALSMGGYSGLGLCATGVSRAIERTMGFHVWGNGNQIDNNLPRKHFKQVHISLAEALKIPGLVLTWEHTSTRLGSIYGHTAITQGNGLSSTSDFVERDTLHAGGRTGLKIFMPLP